VGNSTPGELVIAIDGPSGSGKSSASQGVATELGLRYLDTGAMYRALTWWLVSRGVSTEDRATVGSLAASPVIEVSGDPASPWTRVDGRDVSAEIRTTDISGRVSAVAAVPQVRAHLIGLQQAIIAAAGPGIVAEGRDIGTVVAPAAPVKVFLTAASTARAARRAGEQGTGVAETEAAQDRRDRLDAAQSAMAHDAVLIDSTDMTLQEVIGAITSLASTALDSTAMDSTALARARAGDSAGHQGTRVAMGEHS
jgi:cytidylate kinase